MRKINFFLDNNIQRILIIFLYIQPIINLVTSLMIRFYGADFTLGIIIRSLVLIILGYYSLVVIKSKFWYCSLIYILLITIYIIVYIFNIYNLKGASVLFMEIKYLIKAFYFPLMLLFIFNIFDYKKINIKFLHFIISIYIYIAIIFIANLTQTAFVSYGGFKTGNVGWFYAANEIGSILGIMFPIVLIFVTKIKNKFLTYLILTAYITVLLQIGTKVPFLSVIISLLTTIIYCFLNYIKTKDKINISLLISPFAIMLLFTFIILPYSPAGNNLNMHFKLVNVDSIRDFFIKDKVDSSKQNNINKPNPMNIIYSGRDQYLDYVKGNYNHLSLWRKITGVGYIEIDDLNKQKIKAIEMDFHDLFYRFGLLGFLLYFVIPFLIIYSNVETLTSYFLECLTDKTIMCCLSSILLGVAIASIAGHVLTAPAVSIYLVFIIMILNAKLNSIRDKK